MKNEALMRVSLRYQALYCETDHESVAKVTLKENAPLKAMLKRLAECGYTVSEELLKALSTSYLGTLVDITKLIDDVLNVKLNWEPLVKGWDNPTGESLYDHLITAISNLPIFKGKVDGVTLPCGHLIPNNTFPLDRYNGCPFCGTPFETSGFVYKGQASKLKELRLWTRDDMEGLFVKLLSSPVPLDATQLDSLKVLCAKMDIPENVEVTMKENCMVVISALVAKGNDAAALKYFSTPTDVLRYLWYEKTGKAIIIRPRTLIATARKWQGLLGQGPCSSDEERSDKMRKQLRLKYNRTECRRVVGWLNAICVDAKKAAENMHPYRGMWVRLIRALRLAEYSKRPGFEDLARLMDVFYKMDYTVWGGELNHAINLGERDKALTMLSARPGLFARSLFATMLRFGTEPTLAAFRKVAQNVPSRLILSLTNAAEFYFNTESARYASPITGGKTKIPHNKLLSLYSKEELHDMEKAIAKLYEDVMNDRFAAEMNENKNIYIDPQLFDIPLGVGDRSTTIQDTSYALQGTRFRVEGDKVRLFLQWGVGLPAQHLDMDLSAIILHDNKRNICAYHHLVAPGAKHSGDIRSIPNMVGTAEYIELDLTELREAEARYVVFTCNAYSCGKMPPRLQVGWMSSEYPMKISEKTGVAYDPSCVQHMVRVPDDNVSKGMTFGVLDVDKGEITWLELPNQDQAAFQTNARAVTDYLLKLRAKCSIGKLLSLKAQAQGLAVTDTADEADEVYTYEWALNPADVNTLLG